jgi:dTDP-4-dehydrorhamnose reductase
VTAILVTGKSGQVGGELQTTLAPLGAVTALDVEQMDLAKPDSIRRVVRELKPGIIVNAAAYTAVDKAESEPELAMQVNGVAPGILAEEAKRLGALLVHYSTDYVFDGESDRAYTEEDVPNPINAYGRSKLAGERAIEAVGGQYLILRSSWVYSARGSNFVLTVLRLAREKSELAMVDDQSGSPTWARALAKATAELLRRQELITRESGVYHLTAGGHTSRYAFAQAIIDAMKEVSGIPDGWASIKPITSGQYPLPARRPPYPVTSAAKIKRVFGIEMPRWEDQLRSCLRDLAPAWRSGLSSRALP